MPKTGVNETFSDEEILFLNQLVKSLGEAESKLESSYGKKDYEGFNNSKRFMISISKKIMENLK